MQWLKLQKLIEALMVGDNLFIEDKISRVVLLEYGLHEVANKAQSLRLITTDDSKHLIRQTNNEGEFVREAGLPDNDEDMIDLDLGLCFALARLIASFITQDPNKRQEHLKQADIIIDTYNNKLDVYTQDVDNDPHAGVDYAINDTSECY